MENNQKKITGDNQEKAKIQKEIRSVYLRQELNKNEPFDELEKKLNAKILKITMTIKEQYPELIEYLNEMPITVPTEKNPEITIKNLNDYYDSLNAILTKYKLEHS
ncbi:MAG: hypothetical protein GZ086_13355 [Gelidibacter sp.]|nr:hypothetical protein [Gelidibacter sp.]